jgi:RNA polymerase sigma-70 factor (ECF subfamily)
MLGRLCPGEPEVEGLLALMLLHHARRLARLDPEGRLVSLEMQDRSLWDPLAVEEGIGMVESALGRGATGPYQLQAAIIAVHSHAPNFAETDWNEIAALYEMLTRTWDNPVFELNRVVAVSYADSPERALALLGPLARALAQYQPFHAVMADLLARTARAEEARAAYRSAIALSHSTAERLFLTARMEALG